ncbi:hypothetical protein ACF0H5_014322 [Mactra antiquata]
MKTILAFIALSGFCFTTTLAVKCYECATTSNCEDPFSTSDDLFSKNDCNMCMKSKVEVDGKQVVVRGCAVSIYTGLVKANECKEVDGGVGKVNVCFCDTDGCNHGNSIEMNLTKTVILGMFVWILKYFYM